MFEKKNTVRASLRFEVNSFAAGGFLFVRYRYIRRRKKVKLPRGE